MNIKKGEPQALPDRHGFGNLEPKGPFPYFVPKTNEYRLQSYPGVLDELRGLDVCVTTKLDGCSITIAMHKGVPYVCSRNFSLKEPETIERRSAYWYVTRKYRVLEKLAMGDGNFAIQGEMCGPGIQKNRLGLQDFELFVYQVFDIDRSKYLDVLEASAFCISLGLQTVPVVGMWVVTPSFGVDSFVCLSNQTYFNGTRTEGIVVRPCFERSSFVLPGMSRLSFKVINPEYLLEIGE